MKIKDCKVGMRVKVIEDCYDGYVKIGMVGTIVELSTDGSLLVRFDNFENGHCGYRFFNDKYKYKGHKDMWYMLAVELEPLPEPLPTPNNVCTHKIAIKVIGNSYVSYCTLCGKILDTKKKGE